MQIKLGTMPVTLWLLATCGVFGVSAPLYPVPGVAQTVAGKPQYLAASFGTEPGMAQMPDDQMPDDQMFDDHMYKRLCGTVRTDQKAEKVVITIDSPNPALRRAILDWERSLTYGGNVTEQESAAVRRKYYRFNLKTDGGEALIVYYLDPEYCGTGGCRCLILERQASGAYSVKQDFLLGSVHIARTATAGWHDLVVEVDGDASAITECYLARYNPRRGKYIFVRRPKRVITWVLPEEDRVGDDIYVQ